MVRNAATSIVFLDACRDNPLAANLAQVGRSLDVGAGSRVEAASMMIVYATEPGKVALDGTGRNSPFTGALLRHIDTEGASIGDVMIAVRNDVLSETGGKQRPFESASLTGQFFFKPKPEQTADKSSSSSDEIAVLREQIAKLQADQGALLKSQQEQLSALQKKLAEETKTAEPAAPQPAATDSGTTSRVVGVEPAKSCRCLLPPRPPHRLRSPAPSASPSEDGTKVAATESKDTEEPAPETEKDLRGAVARERHARAARARHARRAVEARLLFRRHQRQLEHALAARSRPLQPPRKARPSARRAATGEPRMP